MNDSGGKTDKTSAQRGEDVAYTLNHAIACSITDLGAPFISQGVAKKIFHTHSNLGEWFLGEGVGDVAAVPVTIAVERYAPALTQSLRKGMESMFGWSFRGSAKREAGAWARNNGFAADSRQADEKQQEIYRYEMEHLPQAAIWTATSMVLNVATQKLFHEHMHKGHDHGAHGHSALAIAGALVVGKGVSTGAVIGMRAAFPDKARQWDGYASRHVFAPIDRAARRLAGIPASDDSWQRQMQQRADAAPAAAAK